MKEVANDERCAFCAVAETGAEAFVVYEDSHAVVFMDKHPINAGHVLVIPKRHAAAFYELDDESFVGLMLAVKRMAAVLEAVYRPKKVGMLAAGFDVAHAHVHVLPMHDYHDITSRAVLEGTRAAPSEIELREAAGQIRRGLDARGAA